MLSQGFDFVLGVTHHVWVVIFQNGSIAVLLVYVIGDKHARIRPSGRAVHGFHVGIHTAIGGDLGKAAFFGLGIDQVIFIFPRHRSIGKEETGCGAEDLCITTPAVALPGGAVSRQICMVILGAPHGAFHEFVQQVVRGFQPTGALHRGINSNGSEILRLYIHIRLHQNILEGDQRGDGSPAVDDDVHGNRCTLRSLLTAA